MQLPGAQILTPLTFMGQPERLFTSMFFHFGLIHLMLNMWALYILAVWQNSCLVVVLYRNVCAGWFDGQCTFQLSDYS